MKRLVLVLVLFAGSQAWAAPRTGGYSTMHNEKESARPPGVAIAGAKPDQVVLYCTTISAGCKGMRQYLAQRGLDYLDKELTTDPLAQAEFEALGGLGVPMLVFRDTLLFSYYPTSFERVLARHASGQAAPPRPDGAGRQDNARISLRPPDPADPGKTDLARPPLNSPRGAKVDEVAPEALAAYLERHPYVAVLFTSRDSTCPPCVEIQPDFEKAAASGLSAIRYARVQWSPWWETPAAVKPLYDKAYLPAVTVYLQGKAVAHQAGGADANSLNAYMEKRFGFTP